MARCIAGEVPFELPKGWAWTRVCSLVSKLGSGSTPRGGQRVYVEFGIPFIRSQNVYNDGLRLEDVAYIDEATNKSKSGSIVYGLDLLLNITGGSIGRCAIVPSDFPGANVNQHVMIIRLIEPSLCRFVHAFVTSPFTQALIFGKQLGSGRGGLSTETFSSFLVPVPPLPEQRRIVEALDKYLALVDEVERNQAELDSLLAQLKSKVLDLAVRGELVEHNPGDEPASELLARIHAEKLAMLERGELKPKDVKNDTVIYFGSDGLRYEKRADGKGEAKCIEGEIPFEIPEGWVWARFSNVVRKIGSKDNQVKTKGLPKEGDYPVISQSATSYIDGYYSGTIQPITSVPVLLFGDHTRTVKYVNQPFVIGADGTKCHNAIGVDPVFLFHAMQVAAERIEKRGYGRHYALLEKYLLAIPPRTEQKRINSAVETIFAATNL